MGELVDDEAVRLACESSESPTGGNVFGPEVAVALWGARAGSITSEAGLAAFDRGDDSHTFGKGGTGGTRVVGPLPASAVLISSSDIITPRPVVAVLWPSGASEASLACFERIAEDGRGPEPFEATEVADARLL